MRESGKLCLSGIPTLIILDEQSELVTLNARQSVSKDPEGKVSNSIIKAVAIIQWT